MVSNNIHWVLSCAMNTLLPDILKEEKKSKISIKIVHKINLFQKIVKQHLNLKTIKGLFHSTLALLIFLN